MINTKIEVHLQKHLDVLLPKTSAKDVYQYALFPCGKLFRASLVWSILKDLNLSLFENSKDRTESNHALLASSIEFHHAYTLLHDDLPCMDDDSIRRGKPCAHLAFNDWKALLSGDGLLILSFALISKIKSPRLNELLAFYTWATGPKGLIQGQYLDLSHDPLIDLKSITLIHELKTARLIQTAILESAILATSKDSKREKALWRFSKLLGINFQLLDDLSELSEVNISDHEKKINPWYLFTQETKILLVNNLDQFENLAKNLQLHETNKIIKAYYEKMIMHFESNLKIDFDILPIILRLKRFCK